MTVVSNIEFLIKRGQKMFHDGEPCLNISDDWVWSDEQIVYICWMMARAAPILSRLKTMKILGIEDENLDVELEL